MMPLKDGHKFGFIADMAYQVREALTPYLHDKNIKMPLRVAHSGDTTFRIDAIAEEALEKAARDSKQKLAYYSEDRGLVNLAPDPEWLLIVDPIDGTRPLICGLEMGVVSIALCKFSHNARFEDILAGVILEIHSGDLYYCEKSSGVSIRSSKGRRISPSQTIELSRMFWSFDTVGRPSKWTFHYLANLIDLSGMEAGVFVFVNAAYSLLRIVTGQLDAHVEVAGRILQDYPESAADFMKVGSGRLMGSFAYDIAAAYLILNEAGCIITDAYGNDLGQAGLLSAGKKGILSFVAASNRELHKNILQNIGDLN